ncbi:MAG: hypothetical protein AAFZ15_15140 [Bacteroidota bacterium]
MRKFYKGKKKSQQSTINNYLFLFLLFCLITTSACTADPPPTLNYKDRQLVDSLFRLQVDSLKPLMDSLCDLRFDSAVQHTVDSIMQERQSEIEQYLERIKSENQNEN